MCIWVVSGKGWWEHLSRYRCDYRVQGIWYQGWHSHRCPPLKNQKRTKFVSVCALTQQDWKTREAKSVVVVKVKRVVMIVIK
jgi:hypothetical protein